MAERVRQMLDGILVAVMSGGPGDLAEIEAMDDEVDALYGSIVEYLGMLSREELGSRASAELFQLMEATNNLEAIGDIIETNLVQLGFARLEEDIVVSDETAEFMSTLHNEIKQAFELAMLAVTQKNEPAARKVAAMKQGINSLARNVEHHQTERLIADEPRRIATYAFETDLIAHLKRIFYFTRRTARVAVPVEERSTS